jgi:Family of unknown function (DUF6492)
MSKQIDLVTVCFADELHLLRLQARSIRLYFQPSLLGRIFIIVNDRRYREICDFIAQKILQEYGHFSAKVEIVNYRDLAKRRLKKLGWRSQQALKILIASRVQSPSYLILDCKNHFIRPVDQAAIWHSDGRLNIGFASIHRDFIKDYHQARAYFSLPLPSGEKPGLPTVTPFPMPTAPVLQMIALLEKTQGADFIDIFMKGPRITEFYLFYAFLEAMAEEVRPEGGTLGGVAHFYHQQPRATFSLMASARAVPEKALAVIAKLEPDRVYGFGVHRAVIAHRNIEIRAAVFKVWQRFGLVNTREEAHSFFELQCLPPKRRWWFF